jgi:hypothetical protein
MKKKVFNKHTTVMMIMVILEVKDHVSCSWQKMLKYPRDK